MLLYGGKNGVQISFDAVVIYIDTHERPHARTTPHTFGVQANRFTDSLPKSNKYSI